METQQNWAENYTFGAIRRHYPETLEQVREIVARSRKVKALGSRHSFNGVADTSEDHISLERFAFAPMIDVGRRTVTVGGGTTYGRLCRELHRHGFALHNMASLPQITVAGACATATHGSGDGNANLATAVAALDIVTADGSVRTLSRERDGEMFPGAVVGLGGLGVVTKLTLDIVPAFTVRQVVYENLPLSQVEADFERIFSSAYSMSLFTTWRKASFDQVWFKHRAETETDIVMEAERFGATLATAKIHPIASLSAEPCTEQGGVPGPWYDRLTHFRSDAPPSVGAELQSEYLVPRIHAVEALRAIADMRERIAPLLQVSEIRTVAADTLWMSTCYGQACVGIHFTWNPDWPGVQNLLPEIEARLAPFQARPHWGKLFTMSPVHLQALYPKLPEFRHLLQTFDPQGKFRNEFLDTYLFG